MFIGALQAVRQALTTLKQLCYTQYGQLVPKGGAVLLEQIFTLVIAPLFVGLVIELVSHWLDEKDDN